MCLTLFIFVSVIQVLLSHPLVAKRLCGANRFQLEK